MRFSVTLAAGLLWPAAMTNAAPMLAKRDGRFTQGEPIDANGKGAPILGEFLIVSTLNVSAI
jgi:oxalate decarboxylase